jgi:hypothetical protein
MGLEVPGSDADAEVEPGAEPAPMEPQQGVAEGSEKKTPGVALSKAYKKDFDGNKPGHTKPETALTGTYSKTGKAGGELKKQGVAEVSNDTLTSYLTKLDRDNLKHRMDPTKRSDTKRMKSGPNFVKAFTKLDNRKQGVAEGSNDTIYPNAEVIKSKNGKPVGEIYQDENGWGFFHYRMDSGNDFIDSREDAIEGLRDLHQETVRSRRDTMEQGVAEAADVMEADLSEEHIMAKDLFKRFDLFKQGKDRALGNKPADKEIMTKEGQLTAERLPKEYIEKAIYRVLMKAYPEVIRQYGSPIVSDAISSVAEMHKDIENIEAEEASIMLHQVINQLKNLQMREEKQRLDPSCWDNKKIGNPKTKVKGGVRVNNCVPK